jgi:OOP family OmpA-OmpF porin
MQGVNFEYDSANLTSAAEARLDEAVRMLRENSSISVNLEGHTDSNGSDTYNSQLSQRRAQSVVDYLIDNGIRSGRLTAIGRGEASPIATNDTSAGRAQNRRVEFIIRN